MPRINGTNNAQTTFLRSFRTNPAGPAPQDWPSPSILRRWLRRPAFRRALGSICQAIRFQSDFQLATAAAGATRALAAVPDAQDAPDSPGNSAAARSYLRLSGLLRLSHLRQRFQGDSISIVLREQEKNDASRRAKLEDRKSCKSCDTRKPTAASPTFTDEQIDREAYLRGYSPPFKYADQLPTPATPEDAYYYKLVMNPSALLAFMQHYDKIGNDHRFQPILLNCSRLL